ncbi:hypothetical protein [Cellulomonas cellasea]|uniref:Uncharacterized protein n=1 Tax=Cellulomonas cellasea TaxID=43670 RepID=A0A7W4UCL4_9CELL|nr:hypothetical protein [Cellulomonas cellasea]MBB2921319.1 hypothetical protein [Cellulomonas cellasea]
MLVFVPKLLSPQLVWPVRPAVVTATLRSIADQVEVTWMSWERHPAAAPLHVTWRPFDAGNFGAWSVGGAELWIGPVSRSDLDAARDLVRDVVLPEARDWLAQALIAGEGWQASAHERWWFLSGGRLDRRDRDRGDMTRPLKSPF